MIQRDSLALRLALSSTVWIVLTLAGVGVVLVYLFENHIQLRFEQQLSDHLEELVAAAEVDAQGRLVLTWSPADPRFNRPHSGWYWRIRGLDDTTDGKASTSLMGESLPTPDPGELLRQHVLHLPGPDAQELFLYERAIGLPRATQPYLFTVAGPVSDVESDVANFAQLVVIVLVFLAFFLTGLVWFQIVFGLRPLGRIQRNLSQIRDGTAQHLPEDYPRELRPLVRDLNDLLDYNRSLLARARTQVGNLAHALKNPLAVLTNETAGLDGEQGEMLQRQVSQAVENVNRYLHRARIAGSANMLGASASLDSVIEDLVYSFNILYRARGVVIQVNGLDGIVLRVDREDLEEMIGNLMDNACKWATTQVRVAARKNEDEIILYVDDDGPGIPEEQRAVALTRGQRLDESAQGSGLGLSIVREIAELYGGALRLDRAPLGGLRAELRLPFKPAQ
ncbi:sensor histidine kinase [Magnetospira thiophila]